VHRAKRCRYRRPASLRGLIARPKLDAADHGPSCSSAVASAQLDALFQDASDLIV
jgi:hypothetical protein